MTPFNGSDNKRPAIQPIQTRYQNHLFRSRLEARWAVFFDWCHVEWKYEPDGYDLGSCSYLPDFWLPDYGIFFEIKGGAPTQQEYEKAEDLRNLTVKSVAVFHGLPSENFGVIFCWRNRFPAVCWRVVISSHDDEEKFGLSFSADCGSSEEFSFNSRRKYRFNPTRDDTAGYLIGVVPPGRRPEDDRANKYLSVEMQYFRIALARAAEARFEHGANPAPPWLR